MKKDNQVLALFDFDGTLTTKDTLPEFIRFVVGHIRYWKGLVWCSPTLTRYVLGWLDNNSAKERLLKHFFQNKSVEELKTLGEKFAEQRIPKMTRPGGLDKLKWHIEQNHDVVIVSASSDIWLKPWTDSLGIKLLSTRLESRNGRLTGQYLGKNCHGEEKVHRIKALYNLNDYDEVYAYGDSSGDKPMLEIASEGLRFFKPFRK